MPTSLAKWFNVPLEGHQWRHSGSAPRGPPASKKVLGLGAIRNRGIERDHLSVCGRETCLDCRQTLLQLHELVFRKVPGATGRNPAGALKQACAKIGVRGAACDVAIGAHQPQTDRDVGNGIMPDLLERGIQ